MNAKKCDRCGKYYDSYNVKKSNANINSLVRANTDAEGKYFLNNNIELCPECMKDFGEWLENESKSN